MSRARGQGILGRGILGRGVLGRGVLGLLAVVVLAAGGGRLCATTEPSARPAAPPVPNAAATRSELESIVELLEDDRLTAAEERLGEILARADNPVARDLLGLVYSRQGRAAEAEEQFTRALAVAPDLAPARQHLARLYLLTDREALAIEQLRAAAESTTTLERDLAFKLAAVEVDAGNHAAAATQLRALGEAHGSVLALLQLARLEVGRGRGEAALEVLRQAVNLAPNSEETLAAYARVALDQRTPLPAVIALEPLVRMHPGVAEYAYLLGVARLQVGDMVGALEILQLAIELAPEQALPHIALGLVLNHQKRYDDADRVLRQAQRLAPDRVELIAAQAEAAAGLGQLDEAERLAARALARDTGNATANLVRGMVLMKRQQYVEAKDALTLAVTADPDSPRAHYQLSLALSRLGEDDAARYHVERYRAAQAERAARVAQLRGMPDAPAAPEGEGNR